MAGLPLLQTFASTVKIYSNDTTSASHVNGNLVAPRNHPPAVPLLFIVFAQPHFSFFGFFVVFSGKSHIDFTPLNRYNKKQFQAKPFRKEPQP